MLRVALVVMLVACDAGTPRQPAPSADALLVEVLAVKWTCIVTHPREIQSEELRVPASKPILLRVTTPEDFGNDPSIALKIAGTTKPLRDKKQIDVTFQFDKPGTYSWKCPTIMAEQRLEVLPAADYDAFLAANDPDDPANHPKLGKKLIAKKGCIACHTTDGTPKIGPSWKGIWGTQVTLADGSTRIVDEEYVRRSILEPSAFGRPGYPIGTMPSFEGQLRDREIAALTAFIKSLKD